MDLAIFSDLKNKDLRRDGIFIAEGPAVVKRLLAANWEIHSLLISEHLYLDFGPRLAGRCAVQVMSEVEISQIVGYPFHRGILAAGIRPAAQRLSSVLSALPSNSHLVIAPLVTELENMGTIIRNAAAFGVGALICGDRGVDPLDRRVIRVSMGAVFNLPIVTVSYRDDCKDQLARYGFELVATVLDSSATLLKEFKWGGKTALVLGNEFSGIPQEWKAICERYVTIPMANGVDSLNLGVASGIFMNEMCNSEVKAQ